MKPHTSKSASKTPEISSPSGTSNKTAGTAKTKRREKSKFDYLLRYSRSKKTKEEAIELLKAAGILDENGELAEQYREPPKRKKKPAAPKKPEEKSV